MKNSNIELQSNLSKYFPEIGDSNGGRYFLNSPLLPFCGWVKHLFFPFSGEHPFWKQDLCMIPKGLQMDLPHIFTTCKCWSYHTSALCLG